MRAEVVHDRLMLVIPMSANETVKAMPGFKYHPAMRRWSVPATPNGVRRAVDDLPGIELDTPAARLLAAYARREEAQAVKGRDGLPAVPGATDAWLHQRQAYWFVREAELPCPMLGMDMGTGKTRVAIGLMEGWEASSALILCPKSVMAVWPSEFEKHASEPWNVIVPPQKATVQKRAAYILREVALAKAKGEKYAVAINYEAFWRPAMLPALKDLAVDVMVMDESHRLKAPGGKQSRAAHQLGKKINHRIALSGTPMPHSPLDIYAQYRVLDESIFGTSHQRFRSRYAIMGGFEGRQVVDYQNMDDLTKKFHSIAFVCKADDVLDLPEYNHVRRTFELSPRPRRAYDALDAGLALQIGDGEVTPANALVKLIRMQQITSGYVRDDDGNDHHVSDDKLDLLADIMEDLPKNEPVVIFCRFHHDIDGITEKLEAQGRRCGELSGRKNTVLIDPQSDPRMREDIDVAVVQEQSGGVGIDLTRAAYCVFYSLSFSLGDYEQALKRVHRPGQGRAVTYIHLVAAGTKDEVVYEALDERRDVVGAVIDSYKEKLC